MRWILCLLLLVAPAWGQDLEWFAPSDRSFRVQLPGPISQVRTEPLLWGSSNPHTSYLFGYTVIPRAATMQGRDLYVALADFLESFMENSGCRLDEKATMAQLDGQPCVQRVGKATTGLSRARALAVGPRVYILECTGVSGEEAERYWKSFKLQTP